MSVPSKTRVACAKASTIELGQQFKQTVKKGLPPFETPIVTKKDILQSPQYSHLSGTQITDALALAGAEKTGRRVIVDGAKTPAWAFGDTTRIRNLSREEFCAVYDGSKKLSQCKSAEPTEQKELSACSQQQKSKKEQTNGRI